MKYKVVGIGELLWDMLPSGHRMGGAPANFACHCRALGCDASIVSKVGADDLGVRLIECLSDLDVDTAAIMTDPEHATGTVRVNLGADGQPKFTIHPDVAWDYLEAPDSVLRILAEAEAVCFGTLGQRSEASRKSIRQLVQATPEKALRIFDVNLRQDFFSAELLADSLAMATALKLSDSELPVLARLLGLKGSVMEQIEMLCCRYSLRMVVFTRGSEGSLLFDGSEMCEHPGLRVTVKDTIGAGDSFTAAVALGMLGGWPIDQISDTANEVAAHVCSSVGAIPEMPPHLVKKFQADAVRRNPDAVTTRAAVDSDAVSAA